MITKTLAQITIVSIALAFTVGSAQAARPVTEIKRDLLRLSKQYGLQADPGFVHQAQLEPLVRELLLAAPQPPVAKRLDLLDGAWHQEFGALDYRSNGVDDQRGIDPELGIESIYQVVSQSGHYYNVSPLYQDGDINRVRIGLLRGEFTIDASEGNSLDVAFTSYPGIEGYPTDRRIWELAPLAEMDALANQITIVPTWIVRLFFGSGRLREVYTDRDLRVSFGGNSSSARETLYVFTRAR